MGMMMQIFFVLLVIRFTGPSHYERISASPPAS